MRIGVVGYGTVGEALAYGFKVKGHRVYINDPRLLGDKKFCEKGFLMRTCDLVFVCVQTPSNQDGSIDLTYLEQAVAELSDSASNLERDRPRDPIIVIKSTVAPGTTLKLATRFSKLKFAVNPEFLRMKHARNDFLYQDRIVIGAAEAEIANTVARAYKKWKCQIINTDPSTAETVKLLSNCFLALKVAYACETARICRVFGVDAKEVMDIVCMDPRIGKSHLDPTLGPIPRESPCLPKDVSILIKELEQRGYSSLLVKTAYDVAVEKIKKEH